MRASTSLSHACQSMSFIWAVMIKAVSHHCRRRTSAISTRGWPRCVGSTSANSAGSSPGVSSHQRLATATRATKPPGFTADVLRQFPQASPYAGRLHRLHASKHGVVIYDYVDENEPLLPKMASKREAGYRSLGYRPLNGGELGLKSASLGRV